MHYVIGSGPAGVACARALLDEGRTVVMLDAGLQLEPERRETVARIARQPPEAWSPDWHAFIREGMQADAKGVPFKLTLGSDFPYQETSRHLPSDEAGIALRPSLAQGGLSNVWGAAMLPYSAKDLRGWPLGVEELAPHYTAAVRLTGLAGRSDRLADFAPLYTSEPGRLSPSAQASRWLRHLQQHAGELARAGWHFGQSRLAVAAPTVERAGCVACGVCLYGCPYGHIYTSTATLAALRAHPRFSYEPGVIVETVAENAAGAAIHGYERAGGARREWRAERVFVAGGPISTTRLLLWSRRAFGQRVWFRDSQYFLFPLLLPAAGTDVTRERLHTLSQIFLEVMDDRRDPHTVHAQLYTYNDMLAQAVGGSLPLPRFLRVPLAQALARRLAVAQSYLHSDHSSRIAVELAAPEADAPPRLRLTGEINPEARRRARQIAWRFVGKARQLGALALPPLLQVTPVGRGHHTGGSFPMRLHPGEFETDLLGRPGGWQRIHAVDSTVFPTIPATTITLSVMANAHRIGTLAARL